MLGEALGVKGKRCWLSLICEFEKGTDADRDCRLIMRPEVAACYGETEMGVSCPLLACDTIV
jgi:hypothetical protein